MASPELLLAFYGDDFSGSSDVLESLERAGIPAVLFLQPPDPDAVARFPGVRAVGVAGVTRTLAPSAMTPVLDGAFRALRGLSPRVVQYKICSTFDSSPEIGSIGRALEVGAELFASRFVPLLVAAPRLGRWCVFGQLFARGNGEAVRLDRHAAMSRHPVTPMDEADLRLHLARQTSMRLVLFDVRSLDGSRAQVSSRFAQIVQQGPQVVLFDALHEGHLLQAGRLLAPDAGEPPLFAVGSAGLTDALCAAWSEAGLCAPPWWRGYGPAERLLVVSGSASPQTAEQIRCARAHGFAEVALDTLALGEVEERRCLDEAARALAAGRSVVLHAADGQSDPRLAGAGPARSEAVGESLARLARQVLTAASVRRLVVAGGDTSGRVARGLGLCALRFVASTAPGSPLLRAYAPGPLDGLELVFKGGQVGDREFFGRVKDGRFPE